MNPRRCFECPPRARRLSSHKQRQCLPRKCRGSVCPIVTSLAWYLVSNHLIKAFLILNYGFAETSEVATISIYLGECRRDAKERLRQVSICLALAIVETGAFPCICQDRGSRSRDLANRLKSATFAFHTGWFVWQAKAKSVGDSFVKTDGRVGRMFHYLPIR